MRGSDFLCLEASSMHAGMDLYPHALLKVQFPLVQRQAKEHNLHTSSVL